MAIDLDCRHPMYLLGRVVSALEGPFPSEPTIRKTTHGLLDNLLTRPAKALPLLLARFPGHTGNPVAAKIMALLPIDLPAGPVDVEEQTYYWTGYYHQRGHEQEFLKTLKKTRLQEKFTPEVLARVGAALFGPDHWQAEMARALHLNDRARVGAWMSDNPDKRRSVPAGVCWDLLAMLRQKSTEAKSLADEIERTELGPKGDEDEETASPE